MTKEKACRNCRKIVEEDKECPLCHSNQLTTFWRGYVLLIDPDRSEIAKHMGISAPGKFALRLSR